MKKLCIIQPLLTEYRIPVFKQLSKYYYVNVLYSPVGKESGFGDVNNNNIGNLFFNELPLLKLFGDRVGLIQKGILKYLIKERPFAVIIFSNPRYFSFWWTLLCGKFLGIPVYPHGHGLYKKRHISLLYRVIYSIILYFSAGYICYAPIVRQSLAMLARAKNKLYVAENSQMNSFPVRPGEKTGEESGILFIGRLRNGCDIDLLLAAVNLLRNNDSNDVILHIIGDGPEAKNINKMSEQNNWLRFYGQVYDQEKIREISLQCRVGCYPGNAGLSVVQMMSLSLPPLIHDDPCSHGPEASYVTPGINGILFDSRNPKESLYMELKKAFDSPEKILKMQKAAFEKYESLTNPSLAERFHKILENHQVGSA